MMQANYHFLCLMVGVFFISTNAVAQTVNFDETWKEFLENNKISNTSELIRPDKVNDELDYAKYLLLNTNSSFCQSDIQDAEKLMEEIGTMDPRALKIIPGYVGKMEDLKVKIKAYHSIDDIWKQFLKTRTVDLGELEGVKSAKTVCEKETLAKYSYMTVYHHLCNGNVTRAKDILENRTLRLTEKTSLRVKDVEGLAPEVANIKALFQGMDKLDQVWKTYTRTGESPGFDEELPLYPCYPIPNMKALVLQGVANVCEAGPSSIAKIKELQAQSGVKPDRELAKKIKELETSINNRDNNLAALNKAWAAFIPNNEVKGLRQYGYEYCTKEDLIRAYIMDGFANVCAMAEEMLEEIDKLQQPEITPLEEITMIKINELAEENEQYKVNVVEIEELWRKFVAQGNTLSGNYELAEFYCDNVHQAQSWIIHGMMGSCEDATQYLAQIEEFQRTFEFSFVEEVECRVEDLRIKVWTCRHEALTKLARIEAPDAYEARLDELMDEYGVGERPEECLDNK